MNISTSTTRIIAISFSAFGIYFLMSSLICRILEIQNFSIGLVVLPILAVFINAKFIELEKTFIKISHQWIRSLVRQFDIKNLISTSRASWLGFSVLTMAYKQPDGNIFKVFIPLSFYNKSNQNKIIRYLEELHES